MTHHGLTTIRACLIINVTTGRSVVEHILLVMRELWGSIMTEEQAKNMPANGRAKVFI